MVVFASTDQSASIEPSNKDITYSKFQLIIAQTTSLAISFEKLSQSFCIQLKWPVNTLGSYILKTSLAMHGVLNPGDRFTNIVKSS